MMEILTEIQSNINGLREDVKRVENKVDGMMETQGLDANASQQWRDKHSDTVREIHDNLSSAAKR